MEVMLALALSSLVLAIISTAIDIHLRVLDSGQTQVEEAQLARAVLRQIADDLRSTVRYEPPESGTPSSGGGASGGMMGAGDGLTDDELPDEMPPSEPDPTEMPTDDMGFDEMDVGGEEPVDLAESETPQATPGLYGNLYQLQLDTSRLPRADQFSGTVTAEGLDGQIVGPISDVKTVTYYVNEAQTAEVTSTSEPMPGSAGLVRREQDRSTSLWASDGAALDPSASLLEPVAPEVAAIEFQYYDGIEWVEEWDSGMQGDLPKAVTIAVWIIPVDLRGNETDTLTETDYMVYRLTVHLPMAGEGSQ